MLEYLEKLVEERRWEEALAYAEQLLHQLEDDPKTLLKLNVAMLICREKVGEFLGAQTIGQLCLKMLKELDAWEYFGIVSLYLGTAHYCMGQYDLALEVWYDYLGQGINDDPVREAMISYNIGVVHARDGKLAESITAFERALEIAQRVGQPRLAHGIRHAMIEVYTKQGDTIEVPRLLAKSLHYIRHFEVSPGKNEASRIWHFVLRAEYALSTGRYTRAHLVASKGLSEAAGHHRLLTALHMVLAKVTKAQGNHEASIEHALSARIEAIACRRYDLELESAEFMYQLLQVT